MSGAFPNAQLNKAGELGLRAGLDRRQGEAMNYEDCAVLLYNALTANNASGSAYGTTLGFTVSNGQVDGSTILLSSLDRIPERTKEWKEKIHAFQRNIEMRAECLFMLKQNENSFEL